MPGKSQLRSHQTNRIVAWTKLLVFVMIAGLGVLLVRVGQMKLRPDPQLAEVVSPRLSSLSELGKRGDLLDARHRLLATSTVAYRLFVDPTMVSDTHTVAVDIAKAIDADPIEIDQRILQRPGRRYVVIDHQLEDWQAQAIRQAKLNGVGLQPRLVRHYPQGKIAASVIGKVGFEHTGLAGMELLFEETLAPRDGRLTYLRDANRRALWIDPDAHRPSVDGRDVQLSIDLVIQQFVEERLSQAVTEFNAGGGRAIVLDCRTGEILAMCDVLNPRTGWDEVTTDPGRAIHPALGRNRCVTDPYEPGSTFKPFVWAVATELGKAQPDEVLPTPSGPAYHTTQGRRIRDSHYHGPVSWRRVLVKSINSGMAMVAERMSYDELQGAVAKFGFGRKTGCGLPGESAGLVTSAKRWTHHTQTSVPMGHEIAVTPVQMVRAFSVFARDGTLPTLRITVQTPEGEMYPVRHQVIPVEVAMLVRSVLREVMVEGTGRRAQSDQYRIFAKSGTAQLPKPKGGGYFEDRYVSSFIGGAPLDDPRIVVLCVMDDPDKALGHYGGAIAGPVVRDIIDHTLTYLGVQPDVANEVDASLATAD